MFKSIKKFLIGRPLENEEIGGQKYNVVFGLPILASDAMSSIAYASEEILIVLIPVIGVLAYTQLAYISAAIILLLLILTFSYRQTIHTYPSGGGSYIVATDNLGHIPGVIAGASLSIDYILTVAVSISSGTAAITSAFPSLFPYTVPICIGILLLIMLGNLRGIKESSIMFSIPTYLFILVILITIVVGIIKHLTGGNTTTLADGALMAHQMRTQSSVSALLVLSAFANGCSALTGVEAVSNAVPNFAKPQVKNAQKVLLLLSFFVMLLFGGVSILANLYHTVPMPDKTVLSQIAAAIYGNSIMYYLVQAFTAIILIFAANTSYSDYPMLMSLIGKDGYMPRQMAKRGDRLSFSNGILVLTVTAGILIVIFGGKTDALIPLYAIGVFISFTLSQFGMFKRWVTTREGNWIHKAVINGLGAFVTFVVVIIIAATKFERGAWIVIIILPIMVSCMLMTKRHYNSIAKQLKVETEDLKNINIEQNCYNNRVIVPIDTINNASIRALKYAATISDHVVAFNVSIDKELGDKLRQKYALLNTDIPLHIKYSPYRTIVEPLLEFIDSEKYNYKPGDIITVILPEFVVEKFWQRILHNGSGRYIKSRLMKYREIVVASMPLQINDEGLRFQTHHNKHKHEHEPECGCGGAQGQGSEE